MIIHTTEGSAQSALDWFQNSASSASAHYIIKQDGGIWQVVDDRDTAYHAGNLSYNLQSIGIELEGWADGNTDFSWQTAAQYTALQNLVSWLLTQYGIPLDRAHLIGHNQVPGVSSGSCAGPSYWGGCGNHHDPGAWWNWRTLMSGLGHTPNYSVLTVQTTCSVVSLPEASAPYITSVWPGQRFVAYDSYNGWYLVFLSGEEAAQPHLGSGEYHWDGWLSSSCVSVGSAGTQLEVTGVFPSRVRIRDGTSDTSQIIASTIDGKRYVATGNQRAGFDGFTWYEFDIAWDTGSSTGWSTGHYVQPITTGGGADTTPPTISAFNVSPSTTTLGQPFTINYTVSDSGGSGLSRVVLRRTSGDGSASDSGWHDISTNSASGNGPVSGSFSDIPPSVGTYWYGMAAFDSTSPVNNSTDERQSGLGPVQRTVTPVFVQKAVLTTPAPGSTLPGSAVTFTWTPGSGVSQYWLYVGTAPGALDLYSQSQGLNLATTVSGLPTDGRTLYVRLWSMIGGVWQWNDYTYTAATTGGGGGLPTMVLAPVEGAFRTTGVENPTCVNDPTLWTFCQHQSGGHRAGGGLGGANDTFAWDMNLLGGADSGKPVFAVAPGKVVKYSGIYAPGETYGAVLIEHSSENGVWWSGYLHMSNIQVVEGQQVDTSVRLGLISNVSNVSIPDHLHFVVYGGTNQPSGLISRNLQFIERTASGGTPAAITSPANGSTLPGSAVTFAWTPGSGVTLYWLYVGSSPGALDLYSASQGLNLATTVSGLPTDGRTLYVRLWSMIGGVWQWNDYTYTAATTGGGGALFLTFPLRCSNAACTTPYSDGAYTRASPDGRNPGIT